MQIVKPRTLLVVCFLIVHVFISHAQVIVLGKKMHNALKCDDSALLERKINLFKNEAFYPKLRDFLFFYALGLNSHRIITCFLNQGFDLETRSSTWFDRTPLHHALACSNIKTINFLIDRGAQLDAKDRLGNTPLLMAARRGLLSIVELLAKKGVLLDVRDEFDYTPLHEAVEKGNVNVVRYLLKNGASIDAQTCNGDTPLHLALLSYAHNPKKPLLKKRLKKIIKLLGSHQPNLNKYDIYNGWNVFNLLENLELHDNERSKLLTLLNQAKKA